MTDADRRACAPRVPWISRDLYAETEITSGNDRFRLEVRAFRLNSIADASLVYCAFRLEDGRWRELRGDDIPGRVAQEGSRLVAWVRDVDFSTAVYGGGESIDRTREDPQGTLDLRDEAEDPADLACDRCGGAIPEGEHHGHGFEVLCEGCYGGRFDAHAAGVAAAMLEEIDEAIQTGDCLAPPPVSAGEQPTRPWASEELRDLKDRYGEDYASDVQREAERRVDRRLRR